MMKLKYISACKLSPTSGTSLFIGTGSGLATKCHTRSDKANNNLKCNSLQLTSSQTPDSLVNQTAGQVWEILL